MNKELKEGGRERDKHVASRTVTSAMLKRRERRKALHSATFAGDEANLISQVLYFSTPPQGTRKSQEAHTHLRQELLSLSLELSSPNIKGRGGEPDEGKIPATKLIRV